MNEWMNEWMDWPKMHEIDNRNKAQCSTSTIRKRENKTHYNMPCWSICKGVFRMHVCTLYTGALCGPQCDSQRAELQNNRDVRFTLTKLLWLKGRVHFTRKMTSVYTLYIHTSSSSSIVISIHLAIKYSSENTTAGTNKAETALGVAPLMLRWSYSWFPPPTWCPHRVEIFRFQIENV